MSSDNSSEARQRVILVPGTWGNANGEATSETHWWLPGGVFWNRLVELGYEPLSFAWSTELDGVIGDNTGWKRAGERLSKQFKQSDTVIGHSHGGQVIAYACEGGLVGNVITLATPVRDDVPYRWIKSATSLNGSKAAHWVHVYGNYSDYWQLLGSMLDLGLHPFRRKMPLADNNVKVNCNHQQTHDLKIWDEYQLWQYL